MVDAWRPEQSVKVSLHPPMALRGEKGTLLTELSLQMRLEEGSTYADVQKKVQRAIWGCTGEWRETGYMSCRVDGVGVEILEEARRGVECFEVLSCAAPHRVPRGGAP